MIEVPESSIYYWMYEQGLKHVPLDEIELACHQAGKQIRRKDYENYQNGYANSDMNRPGLIEHGSQSSVFQFKGVLKTKGYDTTYSSYPDHPYFGRPEISKRWVPCDKHNKPMKPWGQSCDERIDCETLLGCKYVGENMAGTQMIVIDCDGDHDTELDMETIKFLHRYAGLTHCLIKPKKVGEYLCPEHPYRGGDNELPASFHLTFFVDKIIPTMHFPKAHIDIVGNKRNSLRYWKNKIWNGIYPAYMNDAVWDDIMAYIKGREEA